MGERDNRLCHYERDLDEFLFFQETLEATCSNSVNALALPVNFIFQKLRCCIWVPQQLMKIYIKGIIHDTSIRWPLSQKRCLRLWLKASGSCESLFDLNYRKSLGDPLNGLFPRRTTVQQSIDNIELEFMWCEYSRRLTFNPSSLVSHLPLACSKK